jgi:hypothetical protein
MRGFFAASRGQSWRQYHGQEETNHKSVKHTGPHIPENINCNGNTLFITVRTPPIEQHFALSA